MAQSVSLSALRLAFGYAVMTNRAKDGLDVRRSPSREISSPLRWTRTRFRGKTIKEGSHAVSRRKFLKLGWLLAWCGMLLPLPLANGQVQAKGATAESSASMLYDATICVGCRACQTACKTRAKLPAETDSQQLYESRWI